MIFVRLVSCGLEAFLCAAAGACEFGDNQCHDRARGLASCYVQSCSLFVYTALRKKAVKKLCAKQSGVDFLQNDERSMSWLKHPLQTSS